jgi:hypothetical protein
MFPRAKMREDRIIKEAILSLDDSPPLIGQFKVKKHDFIPSTYYCRLFAL